MAKSHATENVDDPERTLCGEAVAARTIDNANPGCKRCLRVIASRYRRAAAHEQRAVKREVA